MRRLLSPAMCLLHLAIVMSHYVRSVEERICTVLHCNPPQHRLGRVAFWAAFVTVLLFLIQWVPRLNSALRALPWLTLVVWMLASIPTLFRWMRWRLLWRLRNRLFVTYALIGLTPVVLFGILAAVAAYVLFGQFANFAATAEIRTQLTQLAANNEELAFHFQHAVETGNQARANLASGKHHAADVPQSGAVPPEVQIVMNMSELQVGNYVDGKLQPLQIPAQHALTSVVTPPAWINGNFRGLVLDHNRVYFRAVTQEKAGTHKIAVITSLPLDAQFLSRVVSGLGRMTLLLPTVQAAKLPENAKKKGPGETVQMEDFSASTDKKPSDLRVVTGGMLPKGANLLDIPVNLPATLDTREWSNGTPITFIAVVTSRPSLLYQRLFRESLQIGSGVRLVIILVAVAFAGLELLAIFLASRLSRTITRSVSDLYHATREVDRGRLDYRIPVSRSDQLAALSRSFNAMSESLVRLLAEQKEKERLQSELGIAQEVQSNLFPSRDVRVGELELHGFCRPARSVSGDYYDFLLLGDGGLCLAMGDISGKGISAALLMAGLHSAVRAYQFSSEEMFAASPAESMGIGSPHTDEGKTISAEVFQSPGNLLRLLNLHLYRSTAPEKYATLFLAYYDASTRQLRYSTGGQLPPLLLRANGSIRRLDQGGTVVGLLDNMLYEEDAFEMEAGDILVAYSDGVTEPENEFGDFGEARMVELVHRNRHLPLQEISDRVMQALEDWIGGAEQPDDITIVLARQH